MNIKKFYVLIIGFFFSLILCSCGELNERVNEKYDVKNIDTLDVNSFIEKNKIVSISLHDSLVSSKIIETSDKNKIFEILYALDILEMQFSYEYNGDKSFIELVNNFIEIGIISENIEYCQSYFVSSDGVIYRKVNNVISYTGNVANYEKLLNYCS